MYVIILKLHIGLVAISLLIYLSRTFLSFSGNGLSEHPLVQKAAGGTTLLLVLSVAALCYSIGQYPFFEGWLTEKLMGLLAYIVMAIISLKSVVDIKVRVVLTAGALGAFVVTLMIAQQKVGFLF